MSHAFEFTETFPDIGRAQTFIVYQATAQHACSLKRYLRRLGNRVDTT
jgi:hypothetical protein